MSKRQALVKQAINKALNDPKAAVLVFDQIRRCEELAPVRPVQQVNMNMTADGFTQDGQLKPEMLQSRDKELGISIDKKWKAHEDLAKSARPVQPGADGWQSGQSPQLVLNEVPLKNKCG
jgi:hypothetical protein